ncbi:hypothetical protein LTR28_005980 [Elasticomyces elasticus]|nr:hypothetical protein LTR28_005980 [Elasticomyces elasticus]
MSDTPGVVSTGRGGQSCAQRAMRSGSHSSIGAGNIGHDPTVYTDGSIVREGVVGESDAPEFSTGRGGAGNIIDSPRMKPSRGPASEDVIPEPALRSAEGYENFHTGRGGGGNVYKEKYGGHSSAADAKAAHSSRESLGDKVKSLFGKKEERDKSPLGNKGTTQ